MITFKNLYISYITIEYKPKYCCFGMYCFYSACLALQLIIYVNYFKFQPSPFV